VNMKFSSLISFTALATSSVFAAPSKREVQARKYQAEQDFKARAYQVPALERRNNTGGSRASITFSNPEAKNYYVDGATIPDVDFDAGPSYSGLMPISSDPNETRKLFFWFWPSNNASLTEDLIFWTNGGPGCSSMEGFLQENGPISWSWGRAHPTYNPYAWTNLSHVLWVEQPVGTGFSQGTPNITNDNELAEQLVGFFNQFLNVFSELKGKNLYLTGESYAGYYVPYIANYIYENTTYSTLPLNLQGIWIADPSTSYDIVQEQIPALDIVRANPNLFALNSTYMTYLESQNEKCGYEGYAEKYLQYPPSGPLPLPNGTSEYTDECDLFTAIFNAALLVNPAFNLYRISDTWPVLWDVLGFPGSFPNQQSPIYFNRTDVKEAIHAPVDSNWEECSSINVYNTSSGYGTNPPSGLSVLPNVIEKSKRTLILHEYDVERRARFPN